MKLGIWPTIVMGQPQIFWGHWRAPHFVGVSPGNQLQKASYSTVGISPTQSRWRHQVPLFIDDDETPHSSQLQAVPLSGTKARTLGQDHSQASSLICNITTVLSMMTISRHWSTVKKLSCHVMSCHPIHPITMELGNYPNTGSWPNRDSGFPSGKRTKNDGKIHHV